MPTKKEPIMVVSGISDMVKIERHDHEHEQDEASATDGPIVLATSAMTETLDMGQSTPPPNQLPCPRCHSQFPSVDYLRDHLAGDHLSHTPYRCPQCSFARFATEFAVVEHNRLAHGGMPFMLQKFVNADTRRMEEAVEAMLLELMK